MKSMTIDGRKVSFGDEKNLLQIIRAQGIELPTFCYHSELSVFGACRMCIVEVENRGILAACHTPPEEGMNVRTNTAALRKVRRMTLELLLANHDRDCTSCDRSGNCKLQELAQRFGINRVRFGERDNKLPIDRSSVSLVRDPNKCILCGDCVRVCKEVQNIGVLEFANRGSRAVVTPAFNKEMGEVECVNCGQCAAVCPTGALVVKPEIAEVWEAIFDPKKTVIAQIAPAVRVAIGEEFGLSSGQSLIGQISHALKQLGVDKVFDTSFAADLTVLEETKEFIERLQSGRRIPQFTSCCPAWVKFVEQYYPDQLENLSSCRSPQQMFGSVAKRYYARELNVAPEDLFVVSIMPCTAKKFEAKREEFRTENVPDVDAVLTTQELAKMIREAGIDFAHLEPVSLDLPFGFATGAGVIFGASGGVAEAVLRNAYEILGRDELKDPVIEDVRGNEGIRGYQLEINGTKVRVGVVHGLGNARRVLDEIKNGNVTFDLIEVMACPGGCVGGAGQPISFANRQTFAERAKGLYREDQLLQMHKSQQNPMLNSFYTKWLQEPGSSDAHHALHTSYGPRRRIQGEGIAVAEGDLSPVEVQVCVGTSCYLKGSVGLLKQLSEQIENEELAQHVRLRAAFCCQRCAEGPNVIVGDEVIGRADLEKIPDIIRRIKDKIQL